MRLDGWEERLSAAIEAARDVPFQWGIHDCATWAFDVRRALIGVDAAAAWRGRYGTALGSRREMLRLGWADLPAMGRALLGEPLRPVTAQRGDIVLGAAFGVCIGSQGAFLAQDGLTVLPLRDCAQGWRV